MTENMAPSLICLLALFLIVCMPQRASCIIIDIDPPIPSKTACENAWNYANFYVNKPDRCELYSNLTSSNTKQCAVFRWINLGSAYHPNHYYYFYVIVRRTACGSLEYAGHTRPRVNETEFEFTGNDTICVSGSSLTWYVTLAQFDPNDPRYSGGVTIQSGIAFGCQPSCCTTSGWANDPMEYKYDVTFETTQSRNEVLYKNMTQDHWGWNNYSCHNTGYSDPKWGAGFNDISFPKRCIWLANNTQSPTESPMDIIYPTMDPTYLPTNEPSKYPSINPTDFPTNNPVTYSPTVDPTDFPTNNPVIYPSVDPTYDTTYIPTAEPTPDQTELSSTSLDMSTLTTVGTTMEDAEHSQSVNASRVQWMWALVGFIAGGIMMAFCCFCYRKRKQRVKLNDKGQRTDTYEDVALVELDEFNQQEGENNTMTDTFM